MSQNKATIILRVSTIMMSQNKAIIILRVRDKTIIILRYIMESGYYNPDYHRIRLLQLCKISWNKAIYNLYEISQNKAIITPFYC